MVGTQHQWSYQISSYCLMGASWCILTAVCIALLFACSIGPAENNASPPISYHSASSDGFTNFETEPVRPLAISADGRYLYALNTADDRLEIFDAQEETLRPLGEITVGLRPVAMVLHGHYVWVVNHLSDSVSVVNVNDPNRPRLIHTFPVGDEPRGIVVAGPNKDRIVVATAKRGADVTPGTGLAQVWIYQAAKPEAAPEKLTLFGTKPRALAASADGAYVYAAVYFSGNGTTTVSGEDAVRVGRGRQLRHEKVPYSAVPKQGAIVRRTIRGWRDYQEQDWTAVVPFELPDYDVFVIDMTQGHPQVVQQISHVGTVLFNMAIQPGSGEIWVSNTEAFNFVPHESRLQAKFASNRITRIISRPDGAYETRPVDLNSHLHRSVTKASPPERGLSLAQPLDLVFQTDGKKAYVAAFGSKKIGVLDGAGRVVQRIDVGFGPGGLALHPHREQLYVLNHLDATVSVVDLKRSQVSATIPLRYDPTPPIVKQGRPFLYDATLTSRTGELSCATCHVFGDVDGLAWDLGNPAGPTFDYPVRLRNTLPLAEPRQSLHPLKGPMITQSLRGLAGTGPFHWRGDRFGNPYTPGDDVPSFKDFNPTFVDLLGLAGEIPDGAMESFAHFVLTIQYPPNPNQPLDRSMDAKQKAGFDFFTGSFLSGAGQANCESCHKLPLGTNRLINFENIQVGRDMKTAHLRNIYQKVGRHNLPGPQVSGFGLLHDGTFDTVESFLRLDTFFFPGRTSEDKDAIRRDLQAYIMAFDTGMAPSVGQQLTISADIKKAEEQRIKLLMSRSSAGDCELTARGWEGSVLRGWLYRNGLFQGDRSDAPLLPLERLLIRYSHNGETLTFTCVPPGDGWRSALDRDSDGHMDGDEILAGSDPANSRSLPAGGPRQ